MKAASLDDLKAWSRQLELLDELSRAVITGNCPIAIWAKVFVDPDGPGVMSFLNPSYSEMFGIEFAEYYQRTDFDVWPHDIALAYMENDHQVIRTGEVLNKIETTESPSSRFRRCIIWKYPREWDGVKVVAGIAAPLTEELSHG